MTTSARITALQRSTEFGFDNLVRWQPAFAGKSADSSAPPAESDFHKLLRQGSQLSDDEDAAGSGDSADNAPTSRDQGNTGSDSGYLLSGSINFSPAPRVLRADDEPGPPEAAPEQPTASRSDSQATGKSTNVPLPGVALSSSPLK